MIDHTSFSVKNYTHSLEYYDQTLEILGYKRVMTINLPEYQTAGYGSSGRPFLWISPMGNESEDIGKAKGLHIAFRAPTVESIIQWYKTCLNLGGQPNGAPGPRTEYHPGYYGAFIIDPNGWRTEACLHNYESQKSA